jgi:SAM-dependent methyltransferase
MCNPWCTEFVLRQFDEHIKGTPLRVLEVGSRNVEKTARDVIHYKEWIGTDIVTGPRVDRIISVYDLSSSFHAEFDLVVCTEVIEHTENWPSALHEMSKVLREGGYLLLTTRCKGFPFHEYAHDYWRYEVSDMERIFMGAMPVIEIGYDPIDSGVGIIAKKDTSRNSEVAWWIHNCHDIKLYNINEDRVMTFEDYKSGWK